MTLPLRKFVLKTCIVNFSPFLIILSEICQNVIRNFLSENYCQIFKVRNFLFLMYHFFHWFLLKVHAKTKQLPWVPDTSTNSSLRPVYTITNTQQIRVYRCELEFGFRTFTLQRCQKQTNSCHFSYSWEFIHTSLFTRVQIRSVSKFVQLCCEFTRVNAFRPN